MEFRLGERWEVLDDSIPAGETELLARDLIQVNPAEESIASARRVTPGHQLPSTRKKKHLSRVGKYRKVSKRATPA